VDTEQAETRPAEQATKCTANTRLLGLDVLRFCAVVLVLGRHVLVPPPIWPEIPSQALQIWKRGGWIGVDLFFVLSGFLVSGLLFGEYKSRGQFSIGRFYVRRGWKIYPPFYALIAATAAILFCKGAVINSEELFAELVFLQSYLPAFWNHTWSLAVEEHFYLLLPLVLSLILKLNRNATEPLRPVLPLAAGVAVLSLSMRLVNAAPYSHVTHLFASHLRLDSLFCGVAISYLHHFHTTWFVETFSRWRAWLIFGGTLLFLPAFVFELDTTPLLYTFGFTVFYLASGAILTGVLLCKIPHHPVVLAAASLGAYSYSIYLWHVALKIWGVPLIEQALGTPLTYGVKITIYFAGAFLAGIAMAKIVELPALRIRDAWFPSRARPLTDKQEAGPALALQLVHDAAAGV